MISKRLEKILFKSFKIFNNSTNSIKKIGIINTNKANIMKNQNKKMKSIREQALCMNFGSYNFKFI